MRLTPQETSAVQRKLVYGDVALIMQMSGMSRSAVRRWLDGETFTPRIAQAVEKLLSDRENSARRLRETLTRG